MCVSGLLDKLEFVERQVVESGRFSNTKEWLDEAGVSKSYLTMLKKRLMSKPNAQGRPDKLRALATAAGLGDNYFLNDVIGVTDTATFDPYPSRQPVIALLKARGVNSGVIDALESIRMKEGDPGREHWMDQALALIQDDRKLEKLLESSEELGD